MMSTETFLGGTSDGLSQVLRLDDGTVVAEGVATAPSGEMVRLRQVYGRPAPAPVKSFTTRTMSGSLLVATSPTEEARLRALADFGRAPAAALAPWNRRPPSADELAAAERARVHAEQLHGEDRQRAAALTALADQPPPKAPETPAPHPAAGSFADPATRDFVTEQAAEALSRALDVADRVARGDWPQ